VDDSAFNLADFDRYTEEHGIPEEEYPAASALWIAERTGGPVPDFEESEGGPVGRATAAGGYDPAVAWRVRESVRADPGSKDVAASWTVRLEAEDGRQASTIVDVSRTAMDTLEFGSVADDTRMALRTQGRTAVENVVRRGDEPPARITCSTEGCRAEA
jgi:hypothetical protein